VPTALITGITGQDGYYLSEHLLSLGYQVHGVVRGQQNPKKAIVARALPDVVLHEGDLLDPSSLRRIADLVKPDEIYNLAAISFVQYSFANPLLTAQVTGFGALNLLEIVRDLGTARFYQASTSEMFGNADTSPQNEQTPLRPRSPYGVAKVFAHHATVNYREAYGLFGVSGILFNHESPKRGPEFVTRKISMAAAAIKRGQQESVELGNLDARRDWGFAGDYVRAMHLMLQRSTPEDFVVGTGETHSVREVAQIAFGALGLHWEDHVVTGDADIRPAEIHELRADATRAREALGWQPTVAFEELIGMMVKSDLQALDANPSSPRLPSPG
jgi:GDPmannose 4,6-dehydratase